MFRPFARPTFHENQGGFKSIPEYNQSMTSIFDSIEKPTLLLDERRARRNIQWMAAKARQAGVQFRPHFKTHQSAEIGTWFREEGVRAITVSSVDMALYFAQHGWEDITIAFPANVRQAGTLAQLAQQIRLGLLVESVETTKQLGKTLDAPVDVWLKIDGGAHRTGLAWDDPEAALRVAQAVAETRNLRLKGLLTHAGNTYGARGAAEVCQRASESATRMDWLRQALAERGVGALLVSVGDTPSSRLCETWGPVDEIRPGNFVFFDAQQVQIGSCAVEDVAVALACPVVAKHPERCEVVLYGGAVHLSKDYLMEGEQRVYGTVALPEGDGWGRPLPGAYVAGLSQEHGVVRMRPEDLPRVAVGDLVCVLPAHSCLTVTLMKRYLTLDGKLIETLNG